MIHVGQKLWFVPSQRWNGSAREVEVESVGRKWAKLLNSRDRIDVETLVVDGRGYISPGRCYEDREEYERETRTRLLWADTYKNLNGYAPPTGITYERIIELRKEFGIETEIDVNEVSK